MAELKTQKNNASVRNFIAELDGKRKKKDSNALVKIFKSATGYKPTMWGENMIGFGSYYYESARSNQKGEWPLVAFSPRKANISIYLMPGVTKHEKQLTKLGKHKVSKGSCLYIKKLEDIDVTVLEKIIVQSVKDMKKKYPDSK